MIDHLDLAEMAVLVTWWLCDYVQVQGSLCCWGTGEMDTCDGPRAGRLSSEHQPFGPKTLPISGPWGASCTGAAGYLWLFVWSNPTQLKPEITARTFKPTLWHLRALAAESRTQLLLWNVIWLIDFGVASLECLRGEQHRAGLWWKRGAFYRWWNEPALSFQVQNEAKHEIQTSQLKSLGK